MSARRNSSLLEVLESRRLMTTFAVAGTPGPDVFRVNIIGADVVVTLNGVPSAMPDADVTEIQLAGAGDNDSFEIIRNGDNPLVLNSGVGDDVVQVAGTTGPAAVSIIGQAGAEDITLGDGAVAQLVGNEVLNTLDLQGSARLELLRGFDAVVSVRQLNMSPLARLDLHEGSLLWDYAGDSPIAFVRSQIISAFNGGLWNGPGITSDATGGSPQTAIGYAEAMAIFPTLPVVLGGLPVDDTTVIARYTLKGDGNLDRTVNIGDFALLAANFNDAARWVNGDFNYDGVANIGDFALLAGNFNRTLPPPMAATFSDLRVGDDVLADVPLE
jgi:hypothetical protein